MNRQQRISKIMSEGRRGLNEAERFDDESIKIASQEMKPKMLILGGMGFAFFKSEKDAEKFQKALLQAQHEPVDMGDALESTQSEVYDVTVDGKEMWAVEFGLE